MESRAKLFGHALHQMLVAFPVGLLATASMFDAVYALTGRAGVAESSFRMIGVGLVSALAAALFGVVDWVAIPRATRARRIGLVHGLLALVAVSFFLGSWLMRRATPELPGGLALELSFVGALSLGVSGWLGGELVSRLGVGIDDDAHLDAPSSLFRRVAAALEAKGE